MRKKLVIALGVFLSMVSSALAAWTPLIASGDFTGITADVLTCAVGIISVVLVVLGIGILIRVLSK